MNQLYHFKIYKFDGSNYIGSTKNLVQRTRSHNYNFKNPESPHHNVAKYKLARSDGLEEISLCVLADCFLTRKSAKYIEQKFIDKYDSIINGGNSRQSISSNENKKSTQKKSYEKNKDKNRGKQNQKTRQYRKDNPEKYKQWLSRSKQKIKCTCCGALIARSGISKHKSRRTCTTRFIRNIIDGILINQ